MQPHAVQGKKHLGGSHQHESDARLAAIQLYNRQDMEGVPAALQPANQTVSPLSTSLWTFC